MAVMGMPRLPHGVIEVMLTIAFAESREIAMEEFAAIAQFWCVRFGECPMNKHSY